MSGTDKRSKFFGRSVVLVSLILAFGFGVVVAEFHVTPYWKLRGAYQAVVRLVSEARAPDVGVEVEKSPVITNLLNLEKSLFEYGQDRQACCTGGALEVVGNRLLGVDGAGTIFVYEKGGNVVITDLNIPTNRDEFEDAIESSELSQVERNRSLRLFRFLDIIHSSDDDGAHLYLSYHFWNPDRQEKTTRVSRLEFANDDFDRFLTTGVAGDRRWQLVFESTPGLVVNGYLGSNRTGGRMTWMPAGDLLVGVGDNDIEMDGPGPQSEHSYGKIIEIDPESLSSRIIARGIRNPQGLMTAPDGRIWETEHGPKGGDELNLIEDGENYGFPIVTLGTDYGAQTWHFSPAGTHEGYRWPIYAWVPSIGVSNLIHIDSVPAPWAGNFLVSSLRDMSLYRLKVHDTRVVVAERIPVGRRIRDLAQLADGTIVLFNQDATFIEFEGLPPIPGESSTD